MTRPAVGFANVEARAAESGGTSSDAIYRMVARALRRRNARGKLLDVGCGAGHLLPYVTRSAAEYVGVDVVRYDGYPESLPFVAVDLDTGTIPLPDGSADIVVAVETIEHLENPRAFVRELARLARSGGWVVVTTPNQRSLLSLLALVVKGHFVAFQDANYPAHLTALLDLDLRRIASECGLKDPEILYSFAGRIPLTARYHPRLLSVLFPRLFSDNLLLIARK